MQINIGIKIDKLTVIELTDKKKNNYKIWLCKCDCGNVSERNTQYLTNKRMKHKCCSECAKENYKKAVTKDGLYLINPRLARVAKGVYDRCNNPKNSSYKNYGGRGIEFKFKSVEHLFNWLIENGDKDNLQIDRIDVNGPYSPENCRIVTPKVNANNKRNNIQLFDIKGGPAIAKYLKISLKRLYNMMHKKGYTLEQIYYMSISDKDFYKTDIERKSLAQRKRTEEWAISKKDAEEIVENIKKGSSINKEAKRLEVDFITVKRAIKRLKDGIYDAV